MLKLKEVLLAIALPYLLLGYALLLFISAPFTYVLESLNKMK